MSFKQWLGAFLIGTGLGLFLFIFLISQNIFTSSYRAYVITSGSMAPKVPLGSVVLTKTKPSYQIGEIVTFKPEKNTSNVVTHRLHATEDQAFLTKGDANEDPDRLSITADQIIGQVYFTIPYLGYLVDFARTPKGFVAAIIIPASIIIYEELKTILNEIKTRLSKLLGGRGVPFTKNLSRSLLLFPIFGFLLLLVTNAGAFFSDRELATGNVLSSADNFGTPSPPPTPTPGRVVINEVYYDPDSAHMLGGNPDEHDFEWVELYNAGGTTVNIKNWQITENSGTKHSITSRNYDLAPGAFVILSKAANTKAVWSIPAQQFIATGENFGSDGLDNNSDHVTLLDSSDNIIDQVSWGSDTTAFNPPLTDIPTGHSWERNPDGLDTNTANDFLENTLPTPAI